MTDKQVTLMLGNVGEYLDCVVVVGFDAEGQLHAFSTAHSQLQQHALRSALFAATEDECVGLLLPATKGPRQ